MLVAAAGGASTPPPMQLNIRIDYSWPEITRYSYYYYYLSFFTQASFFIFHFFKNTYLLYCTPPTATSATPVPLFFFSPAPLGYRQEAARLLQRTLGSSLTCPQVINAVLDGHIDPTGLVGSRGTFWIALPLYLASHRPA